MALFGRDYDRDYGYGYEGYGAGRGYDFGYRQGGYQGGGWGGYDREYGHRGDRFGGTEFHGYDRGYKSRWQTDYGDPFGDRDSRTPMRMIRGEFRGSDRDVNAGYDRDTRYGAYERGYGHNANPASYEPYGDWYGAGNRGRERGWNRGRENQNDWNRGRSWNRGGNRFGYGAQRGGYDRGWF